MFLETVFRMSKLYHTLGRQISFHMSKMV